MLTFIPTPIGNPQDITIRALRSFEKAQLFLCEDTRETKRLLEILSQRFDFTYPKDAIFLSFHAHNGKERITEISALLKEQEVIFVSDAGMPIISDPGQILVEYCQLHAIPYDVLPGACAFVTAYASSGFKDVGFSFYGFLPHKGKDRDEALSGVMNHDKNIVLYESPHRLLKLLEEISSLDGERELFLAKELTKKFQRYYKNEAKKLFEEFVDFNIRGEWVVIIKAKSNISKSLKLEDILLLDIAPKIKAKLLAKVSDISVKEWYNRLSREE